MDKMLISKWEVVLGAPDRVNIPCLMHDTWKWHEKKVIRTFVTDVIVLAFTHFLQVSALRGMGCL